MTIYPDKSSTNTLRSEGEVDEYYKRKVQEALSKKRVIIIAGSVFALATLAPIIILAINAGLFLVAGGGLLLSGMFAWIRIPYWITKQENKVNELIMQEKNRHLAQLKEEAKRNPIEQADNDYLLRNKKHDSFKAALVVVGGKVESFRTKLEKMKKDNPTYDLSKEVKTLEKMELFYNNRMDRLKLARQKLDAFKTKIDEARVKWNFTLEANAAISAMNLVDQNTYINEILTEVSFDTVQQEYASIFAQLEVDAAEMSSRNLKFDDQEIEIPNLEIDEFSSITNKG